MSIPLYLNRRWTHPIWRPCRAQQRARLDAQLRRAEARPDTSPRRGHVVSAAIFATYPCGCGWGCGTAGDERAALPAVPAQKGLRVVLPARRRPRRRPLGAWIRHTVFKRPGGPPTGALWCTLFDAGAPAARGQAVAPRPAPGDWLDDRRQRLRPGGRARARRGAGAAPPGSWASAPPPRRCATSRARGCTARRCRARSSRARCPTRRRRPRRGDGERSSTAGAAWSATTGAPSTPSAGSGSTGSVRGARRARGWTSRSAASGSARCMTPWIANGALSLGGERLRLGGRGARARRRRAPQGGTVEAGGVRSRCAAPQIVSWIYADPAGGEHHSTNCSIAAVELARRRPHAAHRARRRLGARHPRGAARRRGAALPGPVDARVQPIGHRRRRLPHSARELQPVLTRHRPGGRRGAPHDQLLAPQQLDLRVVARVAARRGLRRTRPPRRAPRPRAPPRAPARPPRDSARAARGWSGTCPSPRTARAPRSARTTRQAWP